MTNLGPEARSKRLLHIFNQTGREGQWTRPYEAFSPEVRAVLQAAVRVAPEEILVLVCFRDDDHWFMITTERVFIRSPNQLQGVTWGEIEDATVDPDYLSAVPSSDLRGKLALSRLQIVRRGGAVVEIELEPGPAFFGLWNVLEGIVIMGRPRIGGDGAGR